MQQEKKEKKKRTRLLIPYRYDQKEYNRTEPNNLILEKPIEQVHESINKGHNFKHPYSKI